MKKKKVLVEKFEQQKDTIKHEEKEPPHIRTKEEILKQRKAMMEYKKPQTHQMNHPQSELEVGYNLNKGAGGQFGSVFSNNPKNDGKGKEPNSDLLQRLAFGERAKVRKTI